MTVAYGVNIVGNLTNSQGIVSGFGAGNYATLPFNFCPSQQPYEIVLKFNCSNVSDDPILLLVGDWQESYGMIDIQLSNNKLYAEINVTDFMSNATTTLSANTDYWVKFTYNGVDTYGLYLSTDGISYNLEDTIQSSLYLDSNNPMPSWIGINDDGSTYYLNGSIDLNESYIKLNGNYIWQGVAPSNVQTRIQLRHDTAANWTSVNPVLLVGEVGIETDTLKQKVGDGSTAWNSLSYMGSNEIYIATYGTTTYAEITTALANYKTVICNDSGRLYYYIRSVGGHTFGSSFGANAEYIFIDSNSTWSRGSIYLANKDLSNVTSIDSGSAVQTALDAKVNKSGDTMTGNLVVSKSSANDDSFIELKNTDISGIALPSSNSFSSIDFNANDDSVLGRILLRNTTTAREMRLRVDGINGQNDALCVGIDSSNNSYCTFPNTTCVDGQWVNSRQVIITSGTPLNGSSNLAYTVEVPNDGYVYEAMIRGEVETGSASGNFCILSIQSTEITSDWMFVCGARTRTASGNNGYGTVIVPIKRANNNLIVRRSTNYNGYIPANSLVMLGYRRVGTNS